ncbi:MAG: CoB--CoM heterodisulfide reductase iron-sulfur subunit A family protein [Thermoplasmatales archaeon]|nr:CoB--CoM heterodisulfide reductase iron-sulfur subunit A family protein [Thermoplasmatales archaeon]MCK5635791.1 CoB--CoM heterodisulfide reductase iron-sulfur subunit A family protein [Thermoplasmatales archaeon]
MSNKIGVFICHCGINIASTVNIKDLVDYAKKLDGVVVSKDYKYMCSDVGANLIKDSIKKNKLDGVVIACCSPRMHEHTFRGVVEAGGINAFNLEIANIREQCSWAHEDKSRATEKAIALVRGAVAKAKLLEPLETSKIKVTPAALVIGGGIAGIQSALDLAEEGHKVYLVERSPTIGGRMAQLDKTFPTLDCSGCILTPKMMEVANHPNIELLTYSEVTGVEGSIGNFTIKVNKKARYVDLDKCTGCGDCTEACRLKARITSKFDEGLGKRSAVYIPFPQAVPLKCTIDTDTCLMLTRGKCGTGPLCVEACEAGAIDFKQKDEEVELKVGAIVVATGYDVLDPSAMYEYGYARSDDVITTLGMERLINSSGPTNGEILKPSNGEKPKSITYILCVGSRDESECTWCCRIGCMSALKHVYLLKEKLGDDIEINVCYTDIRSFGKGYEEFYRKIRGMKTNFFRGRPSEVRDAGDHMSIDIFDTTTNKLFEIKTDLVVLVPALVPRADSNEFARILRISQSADGFLLEAHPKLRPMDTFTGGIFITGCCQGPKDIQDSVAQASGAAARAANILSKKELESEPLISCVDEDLCSGCSTCIAICPYNAIELDTEKDGKSHAKINEALCMGCGACVVSCPSGAMQQRGFKDKQIKPMIEETIKK